MLRVSELFLFLVPFAVYVSWLIAGARTPRWAVIAAVALTAGTAAVTVWYGLINAIPKDAAYAPAQFENGEIVPGHAVAKPHH
jgi:hypothetical protein